MNKEQAKSLVRWFVTAFGGVLAGWAAASGWLSSDQIMSVLNSEIFIGITATVVSLVWSMFTHTTSGAVATVAAIPDKDLRKAGVAKIYTTQTPEGAYLARATSGEVVAQR